MKDRTDILIVDLCGTLICEDTTRGFLRWLPLRNWRYVLRAIGFTRGLTVLGRVIRRDITREVLIFVTRGLQREFLYRQAEDYVRDRLGRITNLSVREAITRAQADGARVYVATASLDAVASAVVQQMHLDGMVCSCLGYDEQGICNGRFSTDITGNKWTQLTSIIPINHQLTTTVYTDNPEDSDLIKNAHRVYFFGSRSLLSGLSSAELLKIVFVPSTTSDSSHSHAAS